MITLADLATNSGDKLVQGFINELVTDNYLLGALTFDDCMTATGTSDLVYSYKRGIIPACAGNRVDVAGVLMPIKDHPRVCGEQQQVRHLQIRFLGSSPRVRGTEIDFLKGIIGPGIIPACAGNRRPL